MKSRIGQKGVNTEAVVEEEEVVEGEVEGEVVLEETGHPGTDIMKVDNKETLRIIKIDQTKDLLGVSEEDLEKEEVGLVTVINLVVKGRALETGKDLETDMALEKGRVLETDRVLETGKQKERVLALKEVMREEDLVPRQIQMKLEMMAWEGEVVEEEEPEEEAVDVEEGGNMTGIVEVTEAQ